MATGNTRQSKVFYKGRSEDFVIFVADTTAMQNWRKDHSIPLAQVMDGWKIFTAHQHHGPQGMHNEASRITLEQEFGTSDCREVIFHILEKGESQENIGSG
ncbi:ribosome maturation protein [Penicillium canescens]|nr:ribosome maturation protein [Penicillium canescens]